MKSKKATKQGAANALLEVGVEEIPARFMLSFLDDLKAKAEKELGASRLSFKSVKTCGTARRLVLYIEGLVPYQDNIVEERKGPLKEKAFGADGKPTQACVGFAKSIGVDTKDLKVVTVGGKEYISGVLRVDGQPTERVLPDVLTKILSSLYLPISMRWGEGNCKFIRPVHWIASIYGAKIIGFDFAGVRSSGVTFGHRFLSGPKPLKVPTPVDLRTFRGLLLKNGVVVDQDERRGLIRSQVGTLVKNEKGAPLLEEALVNEVAFLTENPVATIGTFDPAFLKLPKDILITSMKKNQKYFPILDASKKLRSSFVIVTDCPDKAVADSTIKGNEKVLRARLSDAEFFFDEDVKSSLDSRAEELKNVSFHEKLGNMHDKTIRIVELSKFIAKELKIDGSKVGVISRIASLCKTDLITKMVFEFPELQGVMGREYAYYFKEDEVVADGIFEHYLPRYSGDELPDSVGGSIVGLADRIDSIVGYFSVGLVPTGSEDPYALRRLAQGVVEIILKQKFDLILDNVVEHSYKRYEPVFINNLFNKGETGYKDYEKIKKAVLEFLAQRLKGILIAAGIRYDVCDAVLSGFSDVLYSFDNARAIMKNLDSDLVKGVVMTADRVQRLARSATREQVIEADLADPEEKALYDLYMKVNWEAGSAIDSGENEKALAELGKMTASVETFFDKVLVMDKDERTRTNRLALLKSLDIMFRTFADFPKIVLSKS
jgi:glycyl-tRNA synthetase beta chain